MLLSSSPSGLPHYLVNSSIPKWSFSGSLPTDDDHQFCSEISGTLCDMMGIRMPTISAWHAISNGDIERMNHAIPQMLSVIVNEPEND